MSTPVSHRTHRKQRTRGRQQQHSDRLNAYLLVGDDDDFYKVGSDVRRVDSWMFRDVILRCYDARIQERGDKSAHTGGCLLPVLSC